MFLPQYIRRHTDCEIKEWLGGIGHWFLRVWMNVIIVVQLAGSKRGRCVCEKHVCTYVYIYTYHLYIITSVNIVYTFQLILLHASTIITIHHRLTYIYSTASVIAHATQSSKSMFPSDQVQVNILELKFPPFHQCQTLSMEMRKQG